MADRDKNEKKQQQGSQGSSKDQGHSGQGRSQSEGQGRLQADFGKFGGLAHQRLRQAFRQAVTLHGLAQQIAQVGAREGEQIVVCLGQRHGQTRLPA